MKTWSREEKGGNMEGEVWALVLALFSWDLRVVESPSPEARERELARTSLTIL